MLCFHLSGTSSCAAVQLCTPLRPFAGFQLLAPQAFFPCLCHIQPCTFDRTTLDAQSCLGIPTVMFPSFCHKQLCSSARRILHAMGQGSWLPRLCFHFSTTTSFGRLTALRWTHNFASGFPRLCLQSFCHKQLCNATRRTHQVPPATVSNFCVTSSLFCHKQLCNATRRTHQVPPTGPPATVPILLSQVALRV